jgi:hypothetical protein
VWLQLCDYLLKYFLFNNKWIGSGSPPAVSEEKDSVIQCVRLVMRQLFFEIY